MKLVDANVLLYAVDRSASRHLAAKRWLDDALSGREAVLLPWLCLLAFLRLTTHPRVFEHPLQPQEALDVIDGWLSCQHVLTDEPDSRQSRRLREMIAVAGGIGGNIVNDAYLAGLALQYQATVVTFDSDFARFDGVTIQTPG